jgi:hypothetical protein
LTQPDHRHDCWRWPAIGLWAVFFSAGLLPEETFRVLRTLGRVPTQYALINSCHLITLAFAGYLVFFVNQVCRDHGDSPESARGKSLQIGILALAAFIALPLERVVYYSDIPVAEYRRLVLAVAAMKYLTWAYLFTLVFRYYFVEGPRVFLRLPSLFPSVRRQQRAEREQHALAQASEEEAALVASPETAAEPQD